jgi:B12-binding domain/radical SAM domain protein
VICGGPHATARPREVLSWGADAAFVGEAEESLSAFIEQYDDDGIVPARIVEALPLGDFDEYPPFAASRGLFAPIELRRGCVNRCTFCQTPRLHPHIRERSIAAVVHHAEALRAAGKRRVSFIASDALLYGSRDGHVDLAAIEALLAPLKRMGMDVAFGFFPSEIGPATLARCPEAAMLLKRYVSNREIVIGAQSASERMLGRLSRPHTLQDVEDAVAAVVAAGLAPVVDILVCAPGESSDERRETLAWMKQLHARTRARFNLHHFMPLPGTPLEHERPQSIEADAVEELRQLVASGVALGHFTPAWFDTARVEIAASS